MTGNLYNALAGRSTERLAALSDGIFAVAMTLLVLDLHVPSKEAAHGDHDLWMALAAMAPQMVAYLMSFLTLGIFWTGQQAQINYFARGDRHLSWIHLAFLFTVSIMPFSTRLLAEFIHNRVALLCYWANILASGVVLFGSWRYARHAGLLKESITAAECGAVERRIVISQGLYAVAASLCMIDNYWSIGLIVLLQLNYAIAPRYHPGWESRPG